MRRMQETHSGWRYTISERLRNAFPSLVKAGLIFLGSVSVVIGVIGIFVPGLPTTAFLLIAAACYVRSSERLYHWLLDHRVLGKFIRDYQLHRAMPLRSKVVALVSMWTMMGLSVVFFIQSNAIRCVVVACGLIGTAVILRVKTLKKG
jgi:uncharacterized membrane protein YbaN (DUF454 family)